MTATGAPAFDPAVYKETTRLVWERAAAALDGWGGVLERWLAEPTEAMLDHAGVTCGSRVLDVAAGTGGQAIAAAVTAVTPTPARRAGRTRAVPRRTRRARARLSPRAVREGPSWEPPWGLGGHWRRR